MPECVPMSLAKEGPSAVLSSSAFFTSILGHSAAPRTREFMALRKTKCPPGPQIQSDQKLWQGPSTEHPPQRLGTPLCVHPVDGALKWGSGLDSVRELGPSCLTSLHLCPFFCYAGISTGEDCWQTGHCTEEPRLGPQTPKAQLIPPHLSSCPGMPVTIGVAL